MDIRNQPYEAIEGYKNSVSNYIAMMDEQTLTTWVTKQTYIALGTVLTTAAELKIDTYPVEGFDPDKYTELLNLSNQNLKPVVILPIGFRSEKETMADLPKVRKSRTELIVEI